MAAPQVPPVETPPATPPATLAEPTPGTPPVETPPTETPPTETPPVEATAAPEKYEDFTAPEGFEIAEQDHELFRAMNLPQDKAQELVTRASELVQGVIAATQKAQQEQQDAHIQASRANAEIGGKNWDESVALGVRAINKVMRNEQEIEGLRRDLKETGAQHREFINLFFTRIGKSLLEDNLDQFGKPKPPEPKSLEERIYPNYAGGGT